MPKGNPNPSPETRFKPGQSGNPGGKSAEHVAAERKAAEISALMRLQLLSTMQEKVAKALELPEASLKDILELVNGDVLRLFKDSEDRAHGTPRQAVDHTSSDGSMSPDSGIEKLERFLSTIEKRSGETGEPASE
jgi:hypothetical protein